MARRKLANVMKFVDSGGSAAGYHFFNAYECCQMKFFFRYVMGWIPIFSTPALINGSAMHYAKEIFYKGEKKRDKSRIKDGLLAYMGYMSHFIDKIQPIDQERFQRMYSQGPQLFERWVEEYGLVDLRRYEILGVEKEMILPIKWRSNTFKMTGKIDLLVKDKGDEKVYILDTKTTSFSIKEVRLGVSLGDQATAYISMLKVNKPKWVIGGFIADIMYWHDNTKDVNRATLERTEPIVRNDKQIRSFILGNGNLIAEVSSKVKMFKDGKVDEPAALFRRNSQWCNAYFKECEYAPYCSNGSGYDLYKEGKVPFNYMKDGSKILGKVEKGEV